MPMTVAKTLGLPLRGGKFNTSTVTGTRSSKNQTTLEICGVKSDWVVMDDASRAKVTYNHSPALKNGEWNADAPALLGNDYQLKHGAVMDLAKKQYKLTHPKTKKVHTFKVTLDPESQLPIVKLPINFFVSGPASSVKGVKKSGAKNRK